MLQICEYFFSLRKSERQCFPFNMPGGIDKVNWDFLRNRGLFEACAGVNVLVPHEV